MEQGYEHNVEPCVREICPTARQTYSVAATQKYELPTTDVTLDTVFGLIRKKGEELRVIDFSISSASLEEVFIKFAKENDLGIESTE